VSERPRGAAGRVAAVQHQARQTLATALVFALAAPVTALLPHRTGAWLPLHLFLVGALLLAISGATQLLAVTWSAAPAPAASTASVQRWLLAGAAVALAVGREVRAPRWCIALAGAGVVAALVVLAVMLARVRLEAVVDRFTPAIDAYLVAIVFGVCGSVLGTAIAVGALDDSYAAARAAHLTTNLLGLIGLVVAATLPYFVATQARVKQSTRFTPARLRAVTVTMAIATAAAAIGILAGHPSVAAIASFAYAAGIAALATVLPLPRRKQFEWAGARLAQLLAGLAWWGISVLMLGFHHLIGHPSERTAIATLVVGGYAQLLLASLAYFGPVLRGGGHRRLAAGFSTTRSWTGFGAANAAAVATAFDQPVVLGVALGVWAADTAVRTAVLVTASGTDGHLSRDQGP
jgi:hypothetical protein